MASSNPPTSISLKNVIIKGVLLFILFNFIFAPLHPLSSIGEVSVYNVIFPGRVRLPYGDKPDQAYNLTLNNLEAMLASHELTKSSKPSGEFRVLLLGDSSAWGYLLKPENTLSAYLNDAHIQIADGRQARFYNLGYPTLSLIKDLMILDKSIGYQPDLIIWLVTLESFPVDKQIDSPLVQNNPLIIKNLISRYSLNLNSDDSRFVNPDFLQSTLIGQRRNLADILRLQFYGVMWASTGIDQYYPESFEPPQENLSPDATFQTLQPPQLDPKELSFDVLSAGVTIAGAVPILFVNEPIYISHGENSDIRYNFFYPRWAYDQYRQLFTGICQDESWHCLDEWNLVAPQEFTNSAIHLSPAGTSLLADQLEQAVISITTIK